jgi:site-specific recombinase XerD
MTALTGITIIELIDKAVLDLFRLEFANSAYQRYCKGFREFVSYCEDHKVNTYQETTAQEYFRDRFGPDIADTSQKLNDEQLDLRCTLRFLDDVYNFGYGRRNSYGSYKPPKAYKAVLDEYLELCTRNGNAIGTVETKRKKLRQFFVFLEGRNIALADLTSADISDFIVTLVGLKRVSIKVHTSVLRCFFHHLKETGIIETDLSVAVPEPKIYAEESIPETWTNEELQKLLSSIDRTGGVGKRDYAMILLATMLGMRAGDICGLKFENLDWNRKLITYTQQKTGKVNVLPILPAVGDAIIDYLKNGRIESSSKNVFVRHNNPYGEFQSSSALSGNLKRYMSRAGLVVKDRKGAHSLRHTLASCLLSDRTPLLVISGAMGHDNPITTLGYTKVDIPSLRQCSLSYSGEAVSE